MRFLEAAMGLLFRGNKRRANRVVQRTSRVVFRLDHQMRRMLKNFPGFIPLLLGMLLCFVIMPQTIRAGILQTDFVSLQNADTSGQDVSKIDQKSEDLQPRHEFALKFWHSLTGHLHNKAVHIPIGFGLAAFFLSTLALRWHEYQPGVRWLVLVAAMGATAAFITGTAQAMNLEGGSKDWVIDIHRALGITTMSVLWLWAATFWIRPLRRWSWFAGLVAASLITITGFYGGVLAHG